MTINRRTTPEHNKHYIHSKSAKALREEENTNQEGRSQIIQISRQHSLKRLYQMEVQTCTTITGICVVVPQEDGRCSTSR